MHFHEWHMSLLVGFAGGWASRAGYVWLRVRLFGS